MQQGFWNRIHGTSSGRAALCSVVADEKQELADIALTQSEVLTHLGAGGALKEKRMGVLLLSFSLDSFSHLLLG